MAFSSDWQSMFLEQTSGSDSSGAAPRLGIDYLAASTATTSISAITIRQDLAGLGIAGVVWNCARVLVEFFHKEPERLAGARVVELGAGTAAVGLSLALTCSLQEIVITDLDDVVQKLTQDNVVTAVATHAKLQQMATNGRLTALSHRWGSQATKELLSCDVVVCSDCLYEPAVYSDLLATLQTIHPRVAYIAYKQRHPDREKEFFEAAMDFFDVAVWSEAPEGEAKAFRNEKIFVVCLERRDVQKRAT